MTPIRKVMLLWFRNDLRTHDNPALHHFLANLPAGKRGKAVFFISEVQWRQHDWSDIKIDFIKRHVEAIKQQLLQLNIDLDVVEVDTFTEQSQFLLSYCEQHRVSEVIANSELEFNEQLRDQQCHDSGIALRLFEADVIVAKGKVLTQSANMFKVFTPFKRAWVQYVKDHGFEYLGNPLTEKTAATDGDKHSISSAWPLAEQVEQHVFSSFLQNKLNDYACQRDFPGIKGTSGLSPYLAAGLISPRYLFMRLINHSPDILIAIDSPEFTWLNELIWREFYRHLMFQDQRLCQNKCYKEQYQQTIWPNDPALFTAWCQGKTGYPLVDAAMRQLNQTGWMHNRLRMVVASFLTKHLLIDWRWGERYFMQHLIDGDLAANNGGWQWAASTGCDAQPYFRIFNPIRQSERFDPNGDFIRMYIPELANVPAKKIHFPHDYLKAQGLENYWPAIVEHKQARLSALAFYK